MNFGNVILSSQTEPSEALFCRMPKLHIFRDFKLFLGGSVDLETAILAVNNNWFNATANFIEPAA